MEAFIFYLAMNKKIFFLLISVLCLCASCDWLEPEYEEIKPTYYSACQLVHDPSGKNILITDDNKKLFPSETITIPDAQKDSLLNQRFYITFQVNDQSDIRDSIVSINLLSIQRMFEKNVTEIESNDEISKYKNQVLTIQRLWTSSTKLNIVAEIMGSGDKLHNYTLLHNIKQNSDTISFTLRYDNNNDSPVYALAYAMSFDLAKYYPTDQDSVVICFNYKSNFPQYDTLYIRTATK